MAAATLQSLPHDALCRIMKLVDQADRVASMTACRATLAAASSPGVWAEVTFHDLDETAVCFMRRHQCRVVRISSRCPDDVSWFFHRLAKEGVACVKRLYIQLGAVQRVPGDFLYGIGLQSRLQYMEVAVESVDIMSEINFCEFHELSELRTLKIMELTPTCRKLVVWFAGAQRRFTRLRNVAIRGSVSDVIDGLADIPSLRRVGYSFDEMGGESYEQARLAGLELEVMELDVDCETEHATLSEELCECKTRRLVLNVKDEYLDLTGGIGKVEDLLLRMHSTIANVRLDFEALQDCGLRTITLDIAYPVIGGDDGAHTLCFTRVTDVLDWAAHCGQGGPLQLRLLPTTRVHLSPE